MVLCVLTVLMESLIFCIPQLRYRSPYISALIHSSHVGLLKACLCSYSRPLKPGINFWSWKAKVQFFLGYSPPSDYLLLELWLSDNFILNVIHPLTRPLKDKLQFFYFYISSLLYQLQVVQCGCPSKASQPSSWMQRFNHMQECNSQC